MKVALAVWNGRISPVFDVSRELLVVEIEDGRVINRIGVQFSSDHPIHKVRRFVDMGVTVLLCGAISRQLAATLEASGIRRLDFVAGDVESVIAAYLKGALPNPEMSMPGCFTRRRRRRGKNRNEKGRI
ncbi:MAG: NifB/NifX family molybdenum-iron cluster-binding protein [Desulfosalsimonas sp.]